MAEGLGTPEGYTPSEAELKTSGSQLEVPKGNPFLRFARGTKNAITRLWHEPSYNQKPSVSVTRSREEIMAERRERRAQARQALKAKMRAAEAMKAKKINGG